MGVQFMSEKEYIDVNELLNVMDSISISGADGILDFNDGVDFIREVTVRLKRYVFENGQMVVKNESVDS